MWIETKKNLKAPVTKLWISCSWVLISYWISCSWVYLGLILICVSCLWSALLSNSYYQRFCYCTLLFLYRMLHSCISARHNCVRKLIACRVGTWLHLYRWTPGASRKRYALLLHCREQRASSFLQRLITVFRKTQSMCRSCSRFLSSGSFHWPFSGSFTLLSGVPFIAVQAINPTFRAGN